MPLKVYYCFRKLTKKAIRKPEICILFENDHIANNNNRITKWFNVVHTRFQTSTEESGAAGCPRVISGESYKILPEGKRWSLHRALDHIFRADAAVLPEAERIELREKLEREFKIYYHEILKQNGYIFKNTMD